MALNFGTGGTASAKLKAAWDRKVQAAHEQTNIWSAALAEAAMTGSGDLKGLQERLLFEPMAILAASVRAANGMKAESKLNFEALLILSKSLDVTKPISEKVRVIPLKKQSGGIRPVCDFGIAHRTAQQTALRALAPLFSPRRFQCVAPRGFHAAVQQTKAELLEGKQFAAVLDVKRFYQSFVKEKLIEFLPLQEAVVRNVALGDGMDMWLDCHCLPSSASPHIILQQAHQGIPTGSALSALIGSMVFSRLDWSSKNSTLLSYVDDNRLLAKCSNALADDAERLIKAVENLPGGHFLLEMKSAGNVCEGFTFLGHRFKKQEDSIVVHPSLAVWHKAIAKLAKLDAKITRHIKSENANTEFVINQCAKQLAIVEGYKSCFKLCDNLDRFLGAMVEPIHHTAIALNIPFVAIQEAAKSVGSRHVSYTSSLF